MKRSASGARARIARAGLLALLVAGASCSREPVRAPALAAERSLPLTTVVFSGHRYVARADFGLGETVPLMVHGNSSMFLSLTHAVGEKLNGGPVAKVKEYGYSAKGRGVVRVARMRLGGERFTRIPPVPVFDFTDSAETLVQGMVGVPFLVQARAAVDFPEDRLLLGVPKRTNPDPALLVRGYRCVPFSIDAENRATLEARFPALGRALRITPSTVSSALTLHRPLFAGKVPMTRAPSPDRSPNRTTPDEYAADRVDFEIAGVPMRSPASFEDFAEYADVPERELDSFGMLGYDWMKRHDAILDYANRFLYFKP
ncbi:MAG: hypothetical protein ACM3PF_04115 [Bacteroidota bacterium]